MLKRLSYLILVGLVMLTDLPQPQSSYGQESYAPITSTNFSQVGVVNALERGDTVPHMAFDTEDSDILHSWWSTTGTHAQWSLSQTKTVANETMVVGDALMRSPDGNYWAASQSDNTIQVTDADGNSIRTLGGFQQVSNFISFNPTSTMLAATAPTDNLHIWTIDPENNRQRIIPGEAPVRFSADGYLLAFVNPDNLNEVIVENLPGVMAEQIETTLSILTGHYAPITDITISPDSLTIATASEDGTISLWNPYNGAEKLVLLGHRYPVQRIAFNPAGTLLVSVDSGGVIHGFDVATGALVGTVLSFNLTDTTPTELVWNIDGSLFAITGENFGNMVIFGVGGKQNDLSTTPVLSNIEPFTVENTAQGTVEFDVLGGANPINPVGCVIRGGDTVLAVARAENDAWLVLSNSPTCEGAVWIRAAVIQWDRQANLDALPILETASHPAPLVRIPDYEARCTGTLGEPILSSINPNPSVYPPEGIPTELQATLDTGIDALVCHEYVPVRIENCHYLGPGNYSYIFTRYRTDDHIRLIDYDDGTVIASHKFNGLEPPLCPDKTERGEVYGDPPPAEDWAPWVQQIMTSALDQPYLRTTVRIGNLNIRDLPGTDSDVMNRIAVGTPLTLLARDASGEWVAVLLPDMTQGWAFTEYLNISSLVDVESLPISADSGPDIPIIITQY